jgi:hypothetical protein
MPLPNFLVLGASKCGTTTFYYYLKQHPEIFLPAQKELHYFSIKQILENSQGPGDDLHFSGLCRSWGEYKKHFSGVAGEKAIGEVSPSYLYYGEYEEIRRRLDAVKAVILLRNPVDKAYSQYLHLRRHYLEELSFEEGLDAERERRNAGWSDMWRYVDSGLYARQVSRAISAFGPSNVKVLFFEEFVAHPVETMRATFSFLGVDENVQLKKEPPHNRTGLPKSRFVAGALDQKSFLKRLFKMITPDDWRMRLHLKILSANTGQKPHLDPRIVQNLQKQFAGDTRDLQGLLGKCPPWA